MAGTVKVEVRHGWSVFDGTAQRNGGEQLDVDPRLLSSGSPQVGPSESTSRQRSLGAAAETWWARLVPAVPAVSPGLWVAAED